MAVLVGVTVGLSSSVIRVSTCPILEKAESTIKTPNANELLSDDDPGGTRKQGQHRTSMNEDAIKANETAISYG